MFENVNNEEDRNGGIRHRGRGSSDIMHTSSQNNFRSHHSFRPPHSSPASHLLAILLILSTVCITIALMEKWLPKPLMLKDAPSNPNRFIAERAMSTLVRLTNLGPRVSGSYENEVLAVKFFKKEISDIMKSAKPVHKMEVNVQKTSGAFPLTFLEGMTNVYRNVQNVIVKIGSQQRSHHSVLINCHFDTVPESPGGSDDGASCAIMLELLRVISQQETPLVHNLILLFNGAEENLMQASHGFITKHKWASEVRAFINLEACGAGGREILFQAGPNHPWIMQVYAESVPYPYASTLAQEIFQSGIIPGDTDFRIFRDFGKVSGLDFAWSTNGYVYHTKFDNVEQIPLGTLQRTGDNILALALRMSSCSELLDIDSHKDGNLVFFDVLGAFVVRYSETVAIFINISAIALCIYSIYIDMKVALKITNISRRQYLKQLMLSVCVLLASWIFALVLCLVLALLLIAFGLTMTWYSHQISAFFIYVCPMLCISMCTLVRASKRQRNTIKSAWVLTHIYINAVEIVWVILVAIALILHVRSGFIPLLWILFPSIGNILKAKYFSHWTDWKWFAMQLGMMLLPFTQSFYLISGALNLCIPIMGRVGSGNNSEVIIAMLTSSLFALLCSYVIPLILLIRSPQRITSILGGMFCIALILLIFTPMGFPYSGSPSSPSPQRFMIAHSQRTYHNYEGEILHHENGYWIVDFDENSPHSVMALVPEMNRALLVEEDCKTHLYCGVPYLLPVLHFIWRTHWIPNTVPPIIPTPVAFSLVLRQQMGSVIRMNFNLTGPDHMTVMLSPREGLELVQWNFVTEAPLAGPKWNNRDTYFIYLSYASDPEPWSFWIDIKDPDSSDHPRVDVVVTSHYEHGQYQTSSHFRSFLSQFPSWTTITPWTATYDSWIF